jgi:regulator of protease activity HflC (stomatin/prohibitin superfamily)
VADTPAAAADRRVDYSEEKVTVRERAFYGALSGWLMLGGLLALIAVVGLLALTGTFGRMFPVPLVITAVFFFFTLGGFFVINPNEATVLQLAGKYVGSVRREGFHWVIPIYSKRKITLRIRNFESTHLKVNDHDGNPIEIATIIVWRVRDAAEAMFEVDNYENYVRVQTEAALRNLAAHHPYDAHGENQMSLRANMDDVASQLKDEVQQRLFKAGVEVIEARISHLAYAPEIAAAMLRRQQASAVIAARQKIVEGAVSMVEMALTMIAKHNVVEMDEKAKAGLVANLMVVLCAEHNVQPIVNTTHADRSGT